MNDKDIYKDYVKVLKKLENDIDNNTIDGKGVSEEEFKNFIKVIQNKIKESK